MFLEGWTFKPVALWMTIIPVSTFWLKAAYIIAVFVWTTYFACWFVLVIDGYMIKLLALCVDKRGLTFFYSHPEWIVHRREDYLLQLHLTPRYFQKLLWQISVWHCFYTVSYYLEPGKLCAKVQSISSAVKSITSFANPITGVQVLFFIDDRTFAYSRLEHFLF